MMSIGLKYLMGSLAVALTLCAGHILGNMLLIWLVLAAFVALMILGNSKGITLPLMLFFMPWAPLLRPNPDMFSFYTLGLVISCMMGAVKCYRHFQKYHIVLGISLLLLTLMSKLIGGYGLAMDYICFMLMIVLFPVLRAEGKDSKYSFYEATVFFSAGIISAALCAQWFASFYNIAKFIRVDSYLTIVRRCGFYPDPNFYAAHITAALSGCLILILQKREFRCRLTLGILVMVLIYCGFLSGSKSFVLVFALILVLWAMALLKLRGQAGMKFIMVVCGVFAGAYIATSSIFSDLIDVMATRFSSANDMSSFTTNRTNLWADYFEKLMNDIKVLFIGEGLTNVKLHGRASHNTILQMIYQFGIVGVPFLIGWIGCYWRSTHTKKHVVPNIVQKMVLLSGSFLPWMAIDALFFDEFFLLQWFCILGFQEIDKSAAVKRIEENG